MPKAVIYKSTTSFKIGQNEFQIIGVSKSGYDIDFIVTDNDRAKRYYLTYNEYKDISITFSGYEFICSTKPPVSKMDAAIKVQLDGRTISGSLPKPHVPGQQGGKVVVDIWVDNYGIVRKAVPRAAGTSVTDEILWNEVRKAAMKASFNMRADVPAMQKGAITYVFDSEELPVEEVEGEA